MPFVNNLAAILGILKKLGSYILSFLFAFLDQSVEQQTLKLWGAGSSLVGASKSTGKILGCKAFFDVQ